MSRGPETEEDLVERVLAGDEVAFRALYRRHADALFRFALHLTGGDGPGAEDLVQETWVRGVRALPRFEGRSSLRTWLFAIAGRTASEERRRSGSERRKHEGLARLHDDPAAPTVRKPSPRLDLERAIRALSPGFRAVLVLHDVEGYPHHEIARLLGISAGTSKSQLSRARRRVREMLGDDYVTT